MSEIEQETPDSPSGSSRRAALKAGVGVGVGLIAWSGPTITSLGGTPAYAAGCTFVQQFTLADCRNTTSRRSCQPPPTLGCRRSTTCRFHHRVQRGPERTSVAGPASRPSDSTDDIVCRYVLQLFRDPCSQAPAERYCVGPPGGPSASPLAIPLVCPAGKDTANDGTGSALTCNTQRRPRGVLDPP